MKIIQSLISFAIVFVVINWLAAALFFPLHPSLLFIAFVLSIVAAEAVRRNVMQQP